MERVITYIDGFNLYFGLKDSGWRNLLWLDLQKLSLALLKPPQELVLAKYFTARISAPEDKRKRQQTFLEALGTLPHLRIFYGKFQRNPQRCRRCGFTDTVPNEKMTDVNIAVELFADAFQDRYDTALIISADSDLRGAIETVKALFPSKRVVIAFPPMRFSFELQGVAHASFILGRAKLRQSQFPDRIAKPDGYILERPQKWW